MNLRRHGVLAAFAISLCLASAAHADANDPSSRSAVGGSAGAHVTTIPINVPPFHGIEPRLALSYSSQAKNGQVGVGWVLDGIGFIERASPGRGSPRYDATDIYLVNGSS